ncbi:MAG: hypothetical protein AAGG38_06360 [Planctomycetota bacterium]
MAKLATVKFSQFFTDRSGKVLQEIDRAKRRTYSKAGSFVMTTARRSIRTRKSLSRPGAPPSSHDGSLRRGIFFGYDRPRDSVVIGPRAEWSKRLPGGKTQPEVLEFGGTVAGRGRLVKTGSGRGKKWERAKRTLRYAARPFMGPALEKEAPNFPELWADAVRG